MGVASVQVSTSVPCGSLHIEGRYLEVALLPRLPAILSRPLHGLLPAASPSLLGLFGALLMELLTVNAVDLYDVPVNHPEVQKALAFAVEQYNQEREDSANYFKLLRIQDIKAQLLEPIEFQVWMVLGKTTCKKIGKIKKYRKIQKCKQLPRNQEKPNCYFEIRVGYMQFKMQLKIAACL